MFPTPLILLNSARTHRTVDSGSSKNPTTKENAMRKSIFGKFRNDIIWRTDLTEPSMIARATSLERGDFPKTLIDNSLLQGISTIPRGPHREYQFFVELILGI